jgi:hypothetical protein
MARPSRKGAKNWTKEEWDQLFEGYPPTGPIPSPARFDAVAKALGRSPAAVAWMWLDAAGVIGGRKHTASKREQDYLRQRGWLGKQEP